MIKEIKPVRIKEKLSSAWIASRKGTDDIEKEYFCTDKTWKIWEAQRITIQQFPSWKAAIDALHEAGEVDTLLEEYENRRGYPPGELPKKILFALLHDLHGLREVGQNWDGMEDVDKEEILRTSLDIICAVLHEEE